MEAVEKLVKLICQAEAYSSNECNPIMYCSDCPHEGPFCLQHLRAKYLLDNGVALQGWIRTSEKPPTKEDGDRRGYVLAWNSVREYASTKTWHYVNMRPDVFTQWMPLPQPPKGVQ